MESPSLEVFKNHRDVALSDMVSGHGGDGSTVDQMISVVFPSLNDSMTVNWQVWLLDNHVHKKKKP